MSTKVGFGKDCHRFASEETTKPCVIGGIIFEEVPGFLANSDGDVVFHALCNALTSLTGVTILGGVANDLYEKDGITDSEVYLREGLKTLPAGWLVSHVAISLEGKRPYIEEQVEMIRRNVAAVMGLSIEQVGLTAFTGEGLSDCGLGDGLRCTACVSIDVS